jgi:hypothetical protein
MKTILALILLVHGIGHALGILAGIGVKLSSSHSLESWLFSSLLGKPVSQYLGILLSALAIIAFFTTSLSLLGWFLPQNLWESLGITASLISLLLVVFYWNFLPFLFPNKVGVIVIDGWLLLSILWWHWPTALFR